MKFQEYGFQSTSDPYFNTGKWSYVECVRSTMDTKCEKNSMNMHSCGCLPIREHGNHLDRIVMWTLFVDLIYVES